MSGQPLKNMIDKGHVEVAFPSCNVELSIINAKLLFCLYTCRDKFICFVLNYGNSIFLRDYLNRTHPYTIKASINDPIVKTLKNIRPHSFFRHWILPTLRFSHRSSGHASSSRWILCCTINGLILSILAIAQLMASLIAFNTERSAPSWAIVYSTTIIVGNVLCLY